MTHNFEKRIPWSHRISLWVVFGMAFVAPLGWWSLRQIHLENESRQWVPDNDPERLASEWTEQQFHFQDRILLTWEGSSLNDPRLGKLVEQLAGKPDSQGIQRGSLPYVRSVTDPRRFIELMQKNGVEAHESVRRLEGLLVGAGTLKVRLTDQGRTALKKSKRDLQSAFKSKFGVQLEIQDASPDLVSMTSIPAVAGAGETAPDPTAPAVLSVSGELLEKPSLEHDLQLTWKGMRIGGESTISAANWLIEFVPERNEGQPIIESCFFVPGSPVALEVELSEAGLADQGEAVSAILRTCELSGIPAETVQMSGHALRESELNQATQKAAWNPSFSWTQINQRSILLSSILVCAAMAVGLIRKVRLTAVVLIVSCFAVCCTLAIIPIARSTMNQTLIVLPTLLFAWTTVFAINACSTWKKIVSEKEATTVIEASRELRTTCFQAGLAVAFGLAPLCLINLFPIWDLGIYGAIGSVISMICVAYCLPSLMQVLNIRFPKEQFVDAGAARFFGQAFTAHPVWQSIAAIAICLGCAYGLSRSTFQMKAFRDWPDTAQIARNYARTETLLAGTMSAEVVIRFDQQAQKDTNFLDRLELIRGVEEQIRLHPAISGCASIADFQTVTERLAADAGFSQKTKYNKRAALVQQSLTDGELPVARSFYVAADQNQMAAGGNSNTVRPGEELWRVSARVNAVAQDNLSVALSDLHGLIKSVLKMQPGSNHLISGELPEFVEIRQSLSQNLIGSFVLTIILLMGLSVISLRNMFAGAVLVLPCLAPFAVVFGILSWAGAPIETEYLIAAPIAAGIMLDSKLRFLKRFQFLVQQGLTRGAAVVESFADCSASMCQSSGMLAITFAILAQCEMPFINRFGILMAALVAVGLLTDLTMLPQLLAGPLVGVFATSKPAKVETPVVAMPETPAEAPPVPLAAEADAIPSPHIKPHVPPVKKRRATTRREPDPE